MKIGDRIYVRGYIDEIRKDTVIVRNDGGYFGTVLSEVTGELPSAQPEKMQLSTEKTQLSKEDSTKDATFDCISRQAAIDAVNGLPDCPNGFSETYDKATIIGILEDVPSAQPEHTETHSCDYERTETHDLVSRDAVIKAILQLDNLIYTVPDYIDAVRSVPSAEPESRREWYMKGYRDGQPRWIPFKTRPLTDEEKEEYPYYDDMLDCQLPEDGQRILVNVKWNGHESVQMDEYYDDDGSYLDSGYEIGSEATAWMPLPEPYKEGQDE